LWRPLRRIVSGVYIVWHEVLRKHGGVACELRPIRVRKEGAEKEPFVPQGTVAANRTSQLVQLLSTTAL
jgi:hypothetical protein